MPEANSDPVAQLFVSLDKGLGIEAFDVGLSTFPLRASAAGASDGGIGIAPFVFGTTDTTFALSDTLSLVLSASEQLQGGVAVLLRAGRDPQIVTGLLDALQSEPSGRVLTDASRGGARRRALRARVRARPHDRRRGIERGRRRHRWFRPRPVAGREHR